MLVVYLFHYVNDDLNVMTAMTVANDAGIKIKKNKKDYITQNTQKISVHISEQSK